MVSRAKLTSATSAGSLSSPPKPVGSQSQPSLPTTVQRNRLTPRSAEACRRTGIEPSELLPLPREAFREAGQPPEVEKKRWEWYEQMRVEAYQTVRAERDRILKEHGDRPFVEDATEVASSGGSKSKLTGPQAQAEAESKAQEAASEAAEMRALEKIRKKQQAEIEQMLMFEIRSAQLAQEKMEKVQAVQEADQREKEEKQARAMAASEARLQAELEKREAEAAAEREARRRQRAEMERDVRRRAQEAEAERERRLELEKREKERQAKQQARKDRQQALFDKQQQEAYDKQEHERQREVARLERLDEKRQKAQEELAASRERAQRRIALTMQMKEERVDTMRTNYVKKLADEEQRRAEWQSAKQAAIDARVRAGEEKAQHIKEVQAMMEMTVEARKSEIIGREREHMEAKAKADAERERVLEVQATEKEMRMYARQLKLARHQRKDEYRREVVAAKIAMEGQRTESLLDKRQDTLTRRREMRANNSLARQNITDRIEKMRSSSAFEVDDEMRGYIQNRELQELLERCDQRTGGATKVSLDTMRQVLTEMQGEGKLGAMGGGDHGRPQSAGH